jgi:hypothetical protein
MAGSNLTYPGIIKIGVRHMARNSGFGGFVAKMLQEDGDLPLSELIPHERDEEGNFIFHPRLRGSPPIAATEEEVLQFIEDLGYRVVKE